MDIAKNGTGDIVIRHATLGTPRQGPQEWHDDWEKALRVSALSGGPARGWSLYEWLYTVSDQYRDWRFLCFIVS